MKCIDGILVYWKKTFIIGENSTKCCLFVNTSDKFTVFTTDSLKTKVSRVLYFRC